MTLHYIYTALYCEAKPLIEHFRLKKEPQATKYQLFAGDGIRLVVGGTGALRAAAATAYLLARHGANERDLFLNIGACGAARDGWPCGQAVFCHKVIHRDTGRAYYPDVLVRHPLREGVLETFSRPVTRNMRGETSGDVVDMEGAGCFEAASAFLPPHRIGVVKIVTDDLDATSVTAARISQYVRQNMPLLEQTMRALDGTNADPPDILDEQDASVLQAVAERLRLTVALTRQLRQLAAQYKIRTGSDLGCLHEFLHVRPTTKQEGKMLFERVKQRLFHG